jgi:hypothetical protein
MTVARIMMVVLDRPPLSLMSMPALLETVLEDTESPPTDPEDKVLLTLFCKLLAASEPG